MTLRFFFGQMQNVLDVMRRDANHNLRLEVSVSLRFIHFKTIAELSKFDFVLCLFVQDVMLLNQSMLFEGATGMHDRYRDMRLDVDNMSYEVKNQYRTRESLSEVM